MNRPLKIMALLVALAPVGAIAEVRSEGVYDVYFRGLRGAMMTFAGIEENGRYSTRARFESTGLVATFRKESYDVAAQGRIVGGRYVPRVYDEVHTRPKGVKTTRIDYAPSGVPVKKTQNPPRKAKSDRPQIDFATQGDAVDFMTTAFTVFRETPRDQVCAVNTYLFDGTYRAQVVFSSPEEVDGAIRCRAEYRRIGGYTEAELESGTRFPFEVYYVPGSGDFWHVERIEMETAYGRGRMLRR